MAKEEHDQLNLTVVALVALVAIVGLVALVLNVVNLARISTGVGQVSAADDANLAGQPVRYRTGSIFGEGGGGSSSGADCADGCRIIYNQCIQQAGADEGALDYCEASRQSCVSACPV